ncbi:MAG: SLC13 family permease [Promethearchaeota archaeon]
MNGLFLQLIVIFCFIGLVIVLFFEKRDYIFYSVFFILIASLISAIFIESVRTIEFYVSVIEWDVVFFLIAMFTIVEVLEHNHIFDEIGSRVVNRYSDRPRTMFYVICIVSTLMASIVEDLSIAMIFGPIIVIACRKLEITAAPYLLGMTVCINIAATLTPFGSAQNILISNEFNLDFFWFITRLGLYFVIAMLSTLYILDKVILKKDIKRCIERACIPELEEEHELPNPDITQKKFYTNLIALIVYIFLLILIPEIFLAGIIGAVLFVVINPIKNKEGKSRISMGHYIKHIDFRLIFFFMVLFIFVGLMQANGTIAILEKLLENISRENEFILAIIILLTTSVLSGFLDNTPVTVIFIPILSILLNLPEFHRGPLMVAFILGINLGGNFLPQGSAADLMTLQISQDYKVEDLNYKRLFKVGGLFSTLHVVLGIGYLALITFVFQF